jgi:hypothetical protein
MGFGDVDVVHSVHDFTLTGSGTLEISYSPNLSTAEWITEVQQNYDGVPDGATPIAFTNPRRMDWGQISHPIDQAATPFREILRNPSGVCIMPTALDANGSFTNFRFQPPSCW